MKRAFEKRGDLVNVARHSKRERAYKPSQMRATRICAVIYLDCVHRTSRLYKTVDYKHRAYTRLDLSKKKSGDLSILRLVSKRTATRICSMCSVSMNEYYYYEYYEYYEYYY